MAHEPPAEKKAVFHTLIPDHDFIAKPISGNGFSDCPYHYIGFGFKFSWMGDVSDVAQGYSADKAGLQVGDMVTDVFNVKAEEGKVSVLEVKRGNQTLSMPMLGEKICQRE